MVAGLCKTQVDTSLRQRLGHLYLSLSQVHKLPFSNEFHLRRLTPILGTAVSWHATVNPLCGIAHVSIDSGAGALVDASNGATKSSTPVRAILFASSGLRAGTSHVINITFFAIGELG